MDINNEILKCFNLLQNAQMDELTSKLPSILQLIKLLTNNKSYQVDIFENINNFTLLTTIYNAILTYNNNKQIGEIKWHIIMFNIQVLKDL